MNKIEADHIGWMTLVLLTRIGSAMVVYNRQTGENNVEFKI